MPFYDWKCITCNTVKEFHETIKASEEEHICKDCGGVMRKMISSVQFNSKELPKGHNLNATQRRELWNSNDPKDFKKLM